MKLARKTTHALVVGYALLTAAHPVSAAQTTGEMDINDPPPPVGDAVINQAGTDGATVRAVRVEEPLDIDGVIDELQRAGHALADALDAEERDLVETPESGYLLVMIHGITPSELQPLSAIRDRAVAQARAQIRVAARS